ncbi:hypothetical protein A5666_00110 [Mycolicibacterium fortuitum]|uniref:hypothetical protein n=1 Tax=Mycolicibacterium fortuitum TaxID=1766 RepID=UPI0007EB08F2|nr:hypothetical protein [Mycolicibacterium fortuitum]OBA92981.1 hypothetical protein A5665_10750 [Mycolicibacterium fortuitum]OBI66930.1 hypothetical protein A5666_00110 [Mycolicibacterium fortuitum]
MADWDDLFADLAASAETLGETHEQLAEAPVQPAGLTKENRVSDQDAEVLAAADRYEELLPAIRSARPQGPRFEEKKTLIGVDWVIQAWVDAIQTDPAAFGLDSRFGVQIHTVNGAVIVTVTVPAELAGPLRKPVAEAMVAEAARRQNLGRYEMDRDVDDKRVFYLIRENAMDTTHGWREHPKPHAFHRGGAYRRSVFDLCGLVQKNPKNNALMYPQCEFGADERGGIVTLTLPPGMVPKQVEAAVPALRQALQCGELAVTVDDGIHPVVHLNTKKLVRQFPKRNPITADRLWLPKTEAERYACSDEVRLFLGVTEDGTVIAPKLQERSHAAVYGMTNSGKSAALSTIARNLAAQGCEVWLGDSKGDVPLDLLYRENVPGITHLSAVTPALMHATVHKTRELYRFRAAVARELASRGVRDIRWTRVVVIHDELGEFLNTALSDGADPVAQEQAKVTVNMLGEIGAKARAYGVHLIVAGQHAYSAALPAKLKEHLSVRVVFGKASSTHIQRLYEETDKESAKAAREGILPGMKGRGIVLADEGEVVQFQSFYNDDADSATFAKATAGTPRLLRWAHRFPVGDGVPGAHGEWQNWGGWEGNSKHEMSGTVEDIGTVALDLRNPVTEEITVDPSTARWDMTSAEYSPGSPSRSTAFTSVN